MNSDYIAILDRELLLEQHPEQVADLDDTCACPVTSEVTKSGGRTHPSPIPSLSADNVRMLSLQVREPQVQNEDLLSCRAKKMNMHTDALVKLCSERRIPIC